MSSTKELYVAGGCFWCIEADFGKAHGVIKAESGYSGGQKENPTYSEVVTETTGHREAVRVTYESEQTSYRDLLIYFLEHIDPTDAGGQFHDRGESYTTAIFYQNNEEKEIADGIKSKLDASGVYEKPIATLILPFVNFYMAEDYHQKYYEKNAAHYNRYRSASGRDVLMKEGASKVAKVCAIRPVTGDAAEKDLKSILTDMQYKVTQCDDTEPAFKNEYWDNHAEGIYVDVVSGEALFSSHDKYDSGTGWPSFVKPIDENALTTKTDSKLFMPRTEVRSKVADSHLGHVFDDGPKERGGKRYCMNSSSMRFIPTFKLEEEGYGKYLSLFQS